MLTLFLHLMSLAAIFAFGYRFVYRPIAGRLADTVTSSVAAFDHVRKATTDLVRQEVRKIADAAVEDARRKTSAIPERL